MLHVNYISLKLEKLFLIKKKKISGKPWGIVVKGAHVHACLSAKVCVEAALETVLGWNPNSTIS